MTTTSLREEVVELTRALVRVDTSNPPGRETAAAELLAAHLAAAGVECELVGPDPERLNLVARVRGRAAGPSLMLMAHTDVVPAPRADWTVPPFAARIDDGRVIGRGVVDMKGELAARAVALATLAGAGEPPPGDVVLVAEADEERNTADVGMSWLVRERPDLRCDFAVNEGGGLLLELPDRKVFTVSVGEKQVTSLRLRFAGRAGHASFPARADNPLRSAAAAVERLLAYRPPARLVPTMRRALDAVGAGAREGAEAVEWTAAQHPVLADLVPAMTRITVTPTGLRTFEPANVIPPFADVVCDCRALPGDSLADVRNHVERALGNGFVYELEFLEPLEGGTESAIETPLYAALADYVAERTPGAELLPVLSTGFTDSHWVRKAHGTVAYGFAPVLTTAPEAYLRAMHGADEALAIADLEEQARFHVNLLSSGKWAR